MGCATCTSAIGTFVERMADPWIGREIPALLEQAGVEQVRVRGFPTLDRDPSRFAAQAARFRADVVAQSGAITAAERERWLAQLETRPFLGGSMYLFTWGMRPTL